MQTREQQKGRTVGSVLLPVLTVLLVGIIIGVSIFTARALGETMESEGDSFRLTDKTFTAAEGLVYSADVKFTDGQAAGLVFGAAEGTHYWVFNIDRRDNRVKLMYFAPDDADRGVSDGERHSVQQNCGQHLLSEDLYSESASRQGTAGKLSDV